VIPRENAEAVWKAKDVEFDVARIDEIEAVTKHDVIAFLTHLAEIIGNDEARFVHQGMTSSDVLDTTLQRPAGARRRHPARGYGRAAGRAEAPRDGAQGHGAHRPQPRHPRRTHHHGPDLRALLCRDGPQPRRCAKGPREVATGAISGAVGTFANIDPAVEEHVCESWACGPSRSRPR
jgi:adenylosuccinate lyase